MTIHIALILCALAVFAVSCLFVFHREYETGVLRVFGLGLLAIAAFFRIETSISCLANPIAQIELTAATKLSLLTWFGLALYLGGTGLRFLFRYRRRDATWYDARRDPGAATGHREARREAIS